MARLMPTLENKLTTASHRAGEQVSAEDCDPTTVNLIQAVSLQAITQSVARRSVDSLSSYRDLINPPKEDTPSEPIEVGRRPSLQESKGPTSPAPAPRSSEEPDESQHVTLEGSQG